MKRQQGWIPARLSESVGSLSRSCEEYWLCTGELSWLFFTDFMGTGLEMLSRSPGRGRQTVTTHKSLDADADFHGERSGLAS